MMEVAIRNYPKRVAIVDRLWAYGIMRPKSSAFDGTSDFFNSQGIPYKRYAVRDPRDLVAFYTQNPTVGRSGGGVHVAMVEVRE